MTLEELGSKLAELDDIRHHAERELSALQDHQERVEELEKDRDDLLEAMAETVPDGLDGLTGEERNKVYRMLRLEVTPTPEGYSITGALRVRLQNGTDALTRTGANEDGNATGDLDITRQLAITGSPSDARNTIIQAGTTSTNGIDRVLHASSNGDLTLSGATVRYGQINDDGGGIKTDRNLTLTNVAITENDATTGKSGGGISHQGNTLTINGTTISGNTAADQGGGFHTTSGNATLTNVTITNNTAANGGGIRVNSGTKTLVNATVSHNSAATGSNIDRNSGTINLRNTIVSDGSGGANCSGTIGNTANNLDSGTSCGFGTTNSSKSSANANLGTLANNGGPSDTRALLVTPTVSAAIDAGTATGAPNVDQRGETRPKDGDGNGSVLHDIGAYEAPTVAANTAPATTVPAYTPASPKTNDVLQASTTTSDANNNNVSVAWVWKVTRGANTCQVKTETSPAAAPGTRTSSLDLSQIHTTSNCTGASPPASINPSKGDTVIVEATPNDGTVNGTMRSNSVVIANSAPTCATASLATNEDTTGSASPSCNDADGDTLTYSIVDQGTKGTASVTAGGQLQYEPNANENGNDSFTYKANDGAAFSDPAATVNVTINAVNDPPTVKTPAADDIGKNEGATLSTQGAFQDVADNDPLTITKTAGAGTVVDNGDGTWSWSLQTNDNVSGTVTVTADDGGNAGTVNDSFDYSTVNVDPQATFDAPNSVDEGDSFNLSLSNPVDPGSADTFVYAFDCGDGSGYGAFGSSNSTSCSTNDDGTRTVNAKIRDDDDGVTEYTASVSVQNVAPTATKTFDSAVDEGSSFNLKLTDPSDPSSADTAAGFEYRFDCGDGSGYGSWGATNSTSCSTNDNGTRNVKAEIRDKDEGSTEYLGTVTVNNVDPVLSTLSLSGNTGTACVSGNTVNLSFSFSDAGSADTHSGKIEWGDGSADTTFTSSPQNNVSHSYSAGTYTIKVTVTDDDGGSDSDTAQVSKLYNMTGILSPFNTDGSSIFKYGSTVPVKVQITDCAGTPVSGLAPKLSVVMVSGNPPSTTINENITSTSAADSGSVLRYSDPQYIFNMNTKSSLTPDSTATYTAVVKGTTTSGQVVTNPAQVSQKFALKTK
jgi:hypothetical protein